MLPFNASSLPKLRLLGSLLVASALLAIGTASPAAAQDKVIKKAPVQQSDPTSGKAMYTSYCAACHGPAGKGDGPAASELKVAPVDLTQLAKNNGGKFPADHIHAVLDFGAKAPAHGTNEMPVWGTLFRALDQNDQVKVNLRISNLVEYVKTLQAN
ncbi:MAG TPA: cytochrome c [Candidatus Sulfotelmatobacter sp.]|jgi:mono/diheme cytochrome c family protein|nr:cytochrome c [Candidatus Sulfotelmatobacter sp.]